MASRGITTFFSVKYENFVWSGYLLAFQNSVGSNTTIYTTTFSNSECAYIIVIMKTYTHLDSTKLFTTKSFSRQSCEKCTVRNHSLMR
jgi:hypothetical protein